MDNVSGGANWFNQDNKEVIEEKPKVEKKTKKTKAKLPDINKLNKFIEDVKKYYEENRDKNLGDFIVMAETAKNSLADHISSLNEFNLN